MKKFFIVLTSIFILLPCYTVIIVMGATNRQTVRKVLTQRHIVFRIDSDFSCDEKDAIEIAFKRWEKATGNHVTFLWYTDNISVTELFSWQGDGVRTIHKASSYVNWKRHVAQYITTSDGLLGAALYATGDIFVLDDMPGRFETVVAHEIGHVLIGSYHSPDENSIMYATVGLDFARRKIAQKEIELVKQKIER